MPAPLQQVPVRRLVLTEDVEPLEQGKNRAWTEAARMQCRAVCQFDRVSKTIADNLEVSS